MVLILTHHAVETVHSNAEMPQSLASDSILRRRAGRVWVWRAAANLRCFCLGSKGAAFIHFIETYQNYIKANVDWNVERLRVSTSSSVFAIYTGPWFQSLPNCIETHILERMLREFVPGMDGNCAWNSEGAAMSSSDMFYTSTYLLIQYAVCTKKV